MSLRVLLEVMKDHYGGREVDGLARGQDGEVAPCVPTSVSVHPLQPIDKILYIWKYMEILYIWLYRKAIKGRVANKK